MIVITKSFERVVKVDGVLYTVSQDKTKNELSIYRKKDNARIYMHHLKDGYVMYAKQNQGLIKKIFNESHIERFML